MTDRDIFYQVAVIPADSAHQAVDHWCYRKHKDAVQASRRLAACWPTMLRGVTIIQRTPEYVRDHNLMILDEVQS